MTTEEAAKKILDKVGSRTKALKALKNTADTFYRVGEMAEYQKTKEIFEYIRDRL